MEITLKPIGYVNSEIKMSSFQKDVNVDINKEHGRLKYHKIKQIISELVIDPEFDDMLDGIEAFSHIIVIYWPHLLTDAQKSLRKVHPMGRKDLPIQGIFATRCPARPNSILISSVELLERNQNILRVRGLEALDGSPILDIKSVMHDDIENPIFPEWVHQIKRDLYSNN
ncbi:MAG: tRNA (N6-threonylcarbamoyladenosine(37)-N6)-methyltransferase TrmO [Candidatus Magnetomorum sp.]|nr:tRNA (N6-threonylcarbamoyladenosine(37)-N6)-methyltransferase TrmO [Candidatus Magnetomorum sp.]